MTRCYLFAIFVLLLSCHNGKDKPDVSGVKVDLVMERFEKSFFKTDTNNLPKGLAQLRNSFPGFYDDFMQNILQLDPADPASYSVIKWILSGYSGIYDSVEEKYSNLNWLKGELTEGFQFVKHYYPDYRVPRVITYIGTFDAPGVVTTSQYLGIGLHQYAGKNFSVYRSAPLQQLYPAYISRRFDKEYMTANCMKAVVEDVYPDNSTGRPLIEQMIEKGKQWYLLDHFLPDAPDSVKTGFTQKQLEWVNENEGNIWAHLLRNENLYVIEPAVVQTYLGEGPYTQGLPEASPGNIGQWIGWRIVQKFAQRNDKPELRQVLQTPADKIFEGSKYKPK